MDKVPFDTLEVGCKYESRRGEVWEVLSRCFDDPLYPFTAECKTRMFSFTEEGRRFFGETSRDDLVFKVAEGGNKANQKVKHSIDVGAPLTAAKWICENNPYMKAQGKSVDDMLKSIHNSIRWLLEDVERVSTGTAGYVVRRSWEDENYCVIEITVDPCVGSHTYYADVEEYLLQSGV